MVNLYTLVTRLMIRKSCLINIIFHSAILKLMSQNNLIPMLTNAQFLYIFLDASRNNVLWVIWRRMNGSVSYMINQRWLMLRQFKWVCEIRMHFPYYIISQYHILLESHIHVFIVLLIEYRNVVYCRFFSCLK